MSRKDVVHDTVRHALEKDGWTITHDPLELPKVDGFQLKIDLGAERLITAEKGMQKIAIEVKSYISPSAISEFHTTLGQYLNYRRALQKIGSTRTLYLAIPVDIYNTFFQTPFVRETVDDFGINLIAVNLVTERIAQWKKQTAIANF